VIVKTSNPKNNVASLTVTACA